jgi:hypothetical protein
MGKVREVYTYTNAVGGSATIPLAAPSSSIGTTLTNTAVIENEVIPLYDNKKTLVGKIIYNRNKNDFENSINGKVLNQVFLFDDGSYVMNLEWLSNRRKENTKYVNKAVSTGGKYAGKDVTVTLKSDGPDARKVIFEYNN